jgi:phage terminase small subunit
MSAKKKPAQRVKAGTSKGEAAAKRVKFVEAYMANGGNGKEAAITAGYSPATADVKASQLLREVKVRDILVKRRDEIATKFKLTTERVLQEVARVSYSDVRRLFNPDGSLKKMHELDDDTAAALAGVDVVEMAGADGVMAHIPMFTKKVKLWDKNQALEKAMKHLGLFEKDNEQATTERRFIYVPAKGPSAKPPG